MILTKEIFLNHLYGETNEPEPKISDVFICKLRKSSRGNGRKYRLHRDRMGPRLCHAGAADKSAGESGSASTTATLEGTSFSDGDCITAVSHSLSGLSSPGDRRTSAPLGKLCKSQRPVIEIICTGTDWCAWVEG